MLISYTAAVLVALVATLIHGQNTTDNDVRLPPAITTSLPQQIYYRSGETKDLNCGATGIPTPQIRVRLLLTRCMLDSGANPNRVNRVESKLFTVYLVELRKYIWRKNGVLLEIKDNINIQSQGTITISKLTSANAGSYQCFVNNTWGLTATNNANLQEAVLPTFPMATNPIPVQAVLGQSTRLSCNPPQSVPAASYAWYKSTGEQDLTPEPVDQSTRYQVDQQTGDLFFANTQSADATDSTFMYGCSAYNPYLSLRAGGSYTSLTVSGTNLPSPIAPTIAFSTQNPTALTGSTINLACFFNGFPTPSVSWTKQIGLLPVGRYQLLNSNTTLQITNVTQSDAGTYACAGANSAGQSPITLILTVRSVPVFTSPASKPFNMNATAGQSVNFTCDAVGIETPTIVWYRNMNQLNDPGLPGRFSFSNYGKVLTISDVCKSCPGGGTDLQVIQCKASNNAGYAFASGYLNVLGNKGAEEYSTMVVGFCSRDKTMADFCEYATEITDPPHDQSLVATTATVLSCPSTYDPLTPITVMWYFNGKQVISQANLVYTDAAGNLHINTPQLPNGGTSYSGNYTCVVSNGYSSDQASVIISPVIGVYTASVADFWWIFLIFGILLLLIVGVFGVIRYMRQNRGDSYPVDDKERENGNDPDKELQANAFQDYQRSDAAPLLNKTTGSPTGTLNMTSDDGTSFSDYTNDVYK